MALKGDRASSNPHAMGTEQKKLEGGSFKFVTPVPKHEGNDSTDQRNTKQ